MRIEDARALGIPTVFALTYQVPFFTKLGFEVVADMTSEMGEHKMRWVTVRPR